MNHNDNKVKMEHFSTKIPSNSETKKLTTTFGLWDAKPFGSEKFNVMTTREDS